VGIPLIANKEYTFILNTSTDLSRVGLLINKKDYNIYQRVNGNGWNLIPGRINYRIVCGNMINSLFHDGDEGLNFGVNLANGCKYEYAQVFKVPQDCRMTKFSIETKWLIGDGIKDGVDLIVGEGNNPDELKILWEKKNISFDSIGWMVFDL
jgi:hypothetical protein